MAESKTHAADLENGGAMRQGRRVASRRWKTKGNELFSKHPDKESTL